MLQQIQKASFKLFTTCFKFGPTSGHMELIQDLLKSTFIHLDDYIQVVFDFLVKLTGFMPLFCFLVCDSNVCFLNYHFVLVIEPDWYYRSFTGT